MENIVENYAQIKKSEKRQKARLIAIVTAIAIVIVGVIFWQFHSTGIALTNETFCGVEEHTHDDSCYELVLVCDEEESVTDETQIAEVDDTETEEITEAVVTHVHDDSCYEKVLICELEEHTHTIDCMVDISADVETSDDWEATLPTLSGNFGDDVAAIALSQVGYTESERNYQLSADEVTTKGYTRYGAWYGSEYGDWDSMFAAFCLHYAGADNDVMNNATGAYAWSVTLNSLGLYYSADEAQAEVGAIVFIDTDNDGNADTAGVVVEVSDSQITVVEGNYDNAVVKNTYDIDSAVIVGYAIIGLDDDAETTDEETVEDIEEIIESNDDTQTYSVEIYTDETYTKKAKSDVEILVSGVIPEDSVIYAYAVDVEIENTTVICAYDITIFLSDGSVYEPEEALKVEFIGEVAKSSKAQSIYYVDEDNETELISSTTTDDGITFSAEHFSTYAWVEENSISVSSASSLYNAVEDASGTTYIQLTSSFEINSSNYEMTIPDGAEITINLNGYVMTVSGSSALFTIGSDAELTLIDNSATDATKTLSVEDISSSDAGNVAEMTYSNNVVKLTYYVTESIIKDAGTGTTTENLYQYDVTSAGLIRSSSTSTLFKVSGGTLNIGSGFIYGGNAAGRAVVQSSGVVNLTGGYICGYTQTNTSNETYFGGAIKTTAGILNISDDIVLAGNKAPTGGAVALLGGTLNMSGGVISGNTSTINTSSSSNSTNWGGGGIYAKYANVLLSGGYITNNVVVSTNYSAGGGGMLLYGATLNMSGGYITGNLSQAGGGGIKTSHWITTYVYITGGYICSNRAVTCEGGGISIDGQGYCEIIGSSSSIYVNNNRTDTESHWGGGGIFVASDASLYIQTALISENHAGGFGGGVAGCSTGRVLISITYGAAIYANTADGTSLSGTASAKDDDRTYAALSEIFMEYGYQDYYCALSSTVVGEMLGGGEAGWTGSADGVPLSSVSADDILTATYIMGLTAHPTSSAIEAAQSLAALYITGNVSSTHGGGILSNGYLVVGEGLDYEIGSSIELGADKILIDLSTSKKLDVGEGDFTFEVTNELGAVVSIGTTEDGGSIFFDRRLAFSEEGTYTFYIQEVDSSDSSIITDTSVYKLVVTIEAATDYLTINGNALKKTYYQIAHITLSKIINGVETVISDKDVSSSESHTYEYSITSPVFTNYKTDVLSMTVNKEWADGTTKTDSVTVNLYQNDEICDTQVLSSSNDWTYTWSDLQVGDVDDDGNEVTYSYDIKEVVPDGYIAEYTLVNKLSSGVKSTITITNTEVDEVLFSLNITKVDSTDNEITLSGATFNLLDSDGNVVLFSGSNGSYTVSSSGDTVSDVVTVEYGKLVLDGLSAGTYTLKEVEAPTGYEVASDIEIVVGDDDDATIYLTVEDAPEDGEIYLPETGSAGIVALVFGGLVVISGGAYLTLKGKKRKNEAMI